jgi:hypothetical protein
MPLTLSFEHVQTQLYSANNNMSDTVFKDLQERSPSRADVPREVFACNFVLLSFLHACARVCQAQTPRPHLCFVSAAKFDGRHA